MSESDINEQLVPVPKRRTIYAEIDKDRKESIQTVNTLSENTTTTQNTHRTCSIEMDNMILQSSDTYGSRPTATAVTPRLGPNKMDNYPGYPSRASSSNLDLSSSYNLSLSSENSDKEIFRQKIHHNKLLLRKAHFYHPKTVKILKSGNFGSVYKGRIQKDLTKIPISPKKQDTKIVAMKKLKSDIGYGLDSRGMKEFTQEANILMDLKEHNVHDNILEVLGIYMVNPEDIASAVGEMVKNSRKIKDLNERDDLSASSSQDEENGNEAQFSQSGDFSRLEELSENTKLLKTPPKQSASIETIRVRKAEHEKLINHFFHSPILVTAFYPHGDVENFLTQENSRNSVEATTLLKWGAELTDALCHLKRYDIVHRDLAARNVMISGPAQPAAGESTYETINNRYSIKLIDFGLARKIKGEDADRNYKIKTAELKLPLPYLALECLEESIFSHYSDIWALGIFIWEMFTFCKYKNDMYKRECPGYANDWTQLTKLLQEGTRLKQPKSVDKKFYELIKKCWVSERTKRISAKELLNELKKARNELIINDTLGENGQQLQKPFYRFNLAAERDSIYVKKQHTYQSRGDKVTLWMKRNSLAIICFMCVFIVLIVGGVVTAVLLKRSSTGSDSNVPVIPVPVTPEPLPEPRTKPPPIIQPNLCQNWQTNKENLCDKIGTLKCKSRNNTYKCKCKDGYKGQYCEREKDKIDIPEKEEDEIEVKPTLTPLSKPALPWNRNRDDKIKGKSKLYP